MKNFTPLLFLIALPIFGLGQDLLQDNKIIPANRDAEDAFGFAIAVDGIDAMIGSPGKSSFKKYAGGIHSYLLNNKGWTETEFIRNQLENSVDNFGHSIAMHDGVCLVGVPFGDVRSGSVITNCGMVAVYYLDGGSWTFEEAIFPSDNGEFDGEPHGSFGWDIQMNDEHIFIASLATNEAQKLNSGGVYIYSYDDFKKSIQKIEPDTSVTEKGVNIQLAVNDEYLAIGNERENTSDSIVQTGSVHIYRLVDGLYKKVQKITIPDAANREGFGSALAFNNNYLAVRSLGFNDAKNDSSGKVWIYNVGPDSFTLHKTLRLGASIDQGQLSPELLLTDSLLFVGAPEYDFDANGENEIQDAGAVLIYNIADDFALQQTLVAKDRNENDRFGYRFDGTDELLLIGSYSEQDEFNTSTLEKAGAVYVFDLDGSSGLFEERRASLANVYPNPTSGFITIELPEGMSPKMKVQVYTMSGVLVLEKAILNDESGQVLVDLQHVENGMYLIQLSDGLHNYTKRIVKE